MSNSEPHPGRNSMDKPKSDSEDTPLRVSLTVENRDTLLDMMGVLNEQDIAVRTEDISQLTIDRSQTATLDLRELTDKQRRTLEVALDTGYYEQPRKANLGDLAKRLGVSKSAVSQRLRAAETKLVKSALGEYQEPD